MRGKIRIDVYGVIPLKIEETIKLERGNKNYSKIARIDLRSFNEDFRSFICQLKKIVP